MEGTTPPFVFQTFDSTNLSPFCHTALLVLAHLTEQAGKLKEYISVIEGIAPAIVLQRFDSPNLSPLCLHYLPSERAGGEIYILWCTVYIVIPRAGRDAKKYRYRKKSREYKT